MEGGKVLQSGRRGGCATTARPRSEIRTRSARRYGWQCRTTAPSSASTLEELVAVVPSLVLGVGERYPLGIARVPRVLRSFDLLPGSLLVERGHRRSDLLVIAALLHNLGLLLVSTNWARDS